MRVLPLTVLLVLGLSLVPAAMAHSAAVPPEAFTRLLADYSDDCGPTQSLNDCRGSDDLIALDVKEVPGALVFEFVLDKGKPSQASPVTDVLTLSGPGGSKTLSIKTSDDGGFSNAGGFDAVDNARPWPPSGPQDGTRFYVLATVQLSSLGASVGDKISSFNVASTVGGKSGDVMPDLCSNSVTPCTGGDASTVYRKPDYTLRGASYYVDLTGPSDTQTATVGQDLGSPIMLNLKNNFHRTAQIVTLTVDGADGVTAGFHVGDASGATYKQPLDVALDGDSGTLLHLNLHGDRAGASGTLTITASTDQGGRTQIQVPYTVQEAGSATTSTPPHEDSTSSSKGSPAPAAVLVGLVLLGIALRRRA